MNGSNRTQRRLRRVNVGIRLHEIRPLPALRVGSHLPARSSTPTHSSDFPPHRGRLQAYAGRVRGPSAREQGRPNLQQSGPAGRGEDAAMPHSARALDYFCWRRHTRRARLPSHRVSLTVAPMPATQLRHVRRSPSNAIPRQPDYRRNEDTRNTNALAKISVRPTRQELRQTPIKASPKSFTGGNNTVCRRIFSPKIGSSVSAYLANNRRRPAWANNLQDQKIGRSSRI